MSLILRFFQNALLSRNRVALLALSPLLLFALIAPAYWAFYVFQLSIGAVALFFPFGLLIAPSGIGIGIGLIVGAPASLVAMGFMLYRHSSSRVWGWAFPAIPLAASCIVFWAFAQGKLAEQVAAGLDMDWAALVMLAQGAYVLAVVLLVPLILLPQKMASREGTWKRLVGVALFWAMSLLAIGHAQSWTRGQLASSRDGLADALATDSQNPLVRATCSGNLSKANDLLEHSGNTLSEGALDALVRECLRSNTSRFYAERIPLVLQATLAFEARQPSAAPTGCSKRQQALLRTIYQNDFPDIALRAFLDRGLPIQCAVTSGSDEIPVWWSVAYPQHGFDLDTERIQRLERLEIDLLQQNGQGLDFVGANPNYFISGASDATLLRLVELGLRDEAGGRTPHGLVIEVMRRRFGLGTADSNSGDFARLYERVGDPTREQLLHVQAKAPWMLPSTTQDLSGNEARLRQYLAQRLAQ
ncbi:hypothetical protein [Acidovorax delafieldii]|jgi:hypothetical protein|uniref:hypothetical protein n=1 Tax=Acidovorax delafieldii TaxID=47920 RepID=UPI00375652F3